MRFTDRLHIRPQRYPTHDGQRPLSFGIFDGRRFLAYSWSLAGAYVALHVIRKERIMVNFNNSGLARDGHLRPTDERGDENGDMATGAQDVETKQAAVYRKALTKIYYDNEASCDCDCDTETCCNRVGEPCAKCDSRAALRCENPT